MNIIGIQTKNCGYPASSCFLNVYQHVEDHGGKARFGWLAGWVILDSIQTWNHHCVWESPSGALFDITPQIDLYGNISFPQTVQFIPDDDATLLIKENNFHVSRCPKYSALRKSNKVEKAILLLKKADQALQNKNFQVEEAYTTKAGDLLGGWIAPFGPVGVFKPFHLGEKCGLKRM